MNKELKFALELNKCTIIDGWNDAVIGITHSDKPKAVYSVSKCIALIKIKENITFEEAEEFFIYNQLKGEDAPINLSFACLFPSVFMTYSISLP